MGRVVTKWIGEWEGKKSYDKLDVVIYLGESWISLINDNPNSGPPPSSLNSFPLGA